MIRLNCSDFVPSSISTKNALMCVHVAIERVPGCIPLGEKNIPAPCLLSCWSSSFVMLFMSPFLGVTFEIVESGKTWNAHPLKEERKLVSI